MSFRDRAMDWAFRSAPQLDASQFFSAADSAGRLFDRAIGVVSPDTAVRRTRARQTLARYEGAEPSRHRQLIRNASSGNTEVQRSAKALREIARDFDRNHDLARGVLSVLVRNIVGPHGIGVEFMPRKLNGDIDHDFAEQLTHLHNDWKRRPEVTWENQWAAAERLACRTWCRDGEMFSQLLMGRIPTLDHGTAVPFSIEMLEPDLCPLDYNDPSRNIRQGIQRTTWGRATSYWVYKGHPGDLYHSVNTLYPALKQVDGQRMIHPFMSDRIGQGRGVSIFASVINRLHDVKDYEDSERIAAKVAASMAAAIIKGSPDLYLEGDDVASREQRHMKFSPGMIFDNLYPGESVQPIDSQRPNSNLWEYRKGQLQAMSRGTDVGYSSSSGDYDGSYSSQRQELVEQDAAYGVLADQFIGAFTQPITNAFVRMAVLSGAVKVPDDIDPLHMDNAEYHRAPMPWIDPLKEAKGIQTSLESNMTSEPEELRKRGKNPRDVLRQRRDFRQLAEHYNVPLIDAKNAAANEGAGHFNEDQDAEDAKANSNKA